MATIAEHAETVLSPYLGRAGASTCVRATALSLGKTSDQMGVEDLPALGDNVRRSLSLILSGDTVEAIVVELGEGL